MYRVFLFLAVGICVALAPAYSGAQDKKKEDTILGKTITEWIKILREDQRPKWRRAALVALEGSNTAGRAGLGAVVDACEKDKDEQVRLDAVRLLGRLGPEVRPTFKALLNAMRNDKADAVREAAASSLGKQEKYLAQANEYVMVFAVALKDPHPGTRVAVAGVLQKMGEEASAAFPALFAAAKNPKEQTTVRVAAIHVLCRHAKENPQTLPVLLDLAKNSDNAVILRDSAIDGLARLGSDNPELIAALSATLTEKNVEIRKATAIALGTLGSKAKSAWPAVKPRLSEKEEPDAAVRNHLIRLTGVLAKTQNEAIGALIAAARDDKSSENRIAAIQELGELGPLAKEAMPALKAIAAEDARAAIRETAGKALKQINAP